MALVAAALRAANAAGHKYCMAVIMLILMLELVAHHHHDYDSSVEWAPTARRLQAMDTDSSSVAATATTTVTTSLASTSDTAITTTAAAANASESSASTAAMTTASPRRPGGGRCRSDMPGVDDPVELLQNRAIVAANMICPFLGSLMLAGVLPAICILHRSQLLEATVNAGLESGKAMRHIDGNFRNIPGGYIDVCCMEGATSEHVTSTGINDCETTFLNCSRDEQGTLSCADVQTEQCSLPSRDRFETFFDIVDRNRDGNITRSELEAVDERRFFNDANPGGEGTIIGSFSLLMDVFGNINATTGLPDHFTRATLEQVLLRREFPPHYNQVALRRAAEVALTTVVASTTAMMTSVANMSVSMSTSATPTP